MQNKQKKFTSKLALQMQNSLVGAKDPTDAILWHAKLLVIESGIKEPPYAPALYAPIRKITEIKDQNILAEGQLIPLPDGNFNIELRKDRSPQRKNFTCCHEIAHTFFFEVSPSIKYRSSTDFTHNNFNNQNYNEEEEILCNKAAAELIMPHNKITQITRDYTPSSKSIIEIANKFESSIIATILRVHSLNLWEETFILWQAKGNKLIAEWQIEKNQQICYKPNLQIENLRESSLYNTLITGKSNKNTELISKNNQYRYFTIQSEKLGKDLILSCLLKNKKDCKDNAKECKNRPQQFLLPFEYECKCNGTGWKPIIHNGKKYVMRCKAIHSK